MNKILLFLAVIFTISANSQNNAFTFNGIDQQIATYTQQTNIRFTTQNFTIEAWVKPAAFVNSTGNFEHTIIGNDSSNTTGYVLRTGGNRKLDFTFGDGSSWHSVTSSNPVFTVDEWTHVAVVRNGTSFTLYANGVQVAQQIFTQNISLPNTNLRIAESAGFSGRFFNGFLDEIKIWNTARTVAEVRNDLTTTLTPLPAELVVYYKMDQTTGQAVVSETAINLFAQYLPTTQVNSGAGFFRTYTFQTAGSWYFNSNNWMNNFEPSNLVAGDVININANCNYNNSSFDLPFGCVLNINNGATLEMSQSQDIIFINYGTMNIFDSFLFPRSQGTNKFISYGTVNLAVGSDFKSANEIYLNSGSIFNNNGFLGDYNAAFQCDLYNFSGALNNFSGAMISFNKIENQDGTVTNSGSITTTIFSNGSPSYLNSTTNNLAGTITILKKLNNYATFNNYANVILSDILLTSTNTNFTSGIINNYGYPSVFRVDVSAKIKNQGLFTYQNLVENKGIFTNETSGTVKAVAGGIAGSVRQFENFAGASFANNGTYILLEDFNNSGSHSNTGAHSGSGNFNGSVFTNPTNASILPSDNSGTGIGTLSFFSGLTNNGNVNIEINGLNAGIQHDKINVTGTATLGGILNATLLNNYIPPVGTTEFTIISATAVSGTFATVNLPTATQGVVWSIIYTSTAVKIKSVVTALTNTYLITRCDTYTWTINNQTYTISGDYFFPVPNSNITQKLSLTILPATENITTASGCNEFYWSHNFTYYNQSGTYIGNTINCVTEKLILTIVPRTENPTAISACNSYTWANTGQTYTQSGDYVGTTNGCVTERLNLIITPSSENNVFETACGTYTWATNGQTYITSGLYTSTINCVTQKLNLTIFPITTSSLTVASCYAYAWPDTEDIITTSGIYTNTDNCETTTLNLTINQGPTITGNSNQNLNINATLSNIIINPANVVWYDNFENALTGTSPLLNTQVVTNGTTYFAVANDGTCPSLPFAVSITTSNLANENFELKDLNYYPNPTSNILNISHSEKITDIEVSNVLGQKLIVEKVNKNDCKLDLSNLSNATYFVKIKTFDKEKIVKVLKQ
jgi:Concanavalin A-like lectin/glucanases superfamily/Secretion system C-terminal sorting domain